MSVCKGENERTMNRINRAAFSKRKRPLLPLLWSLSPIFILTIASACDMTGSYVDSNSAKACEAVPKLNAGAQPLKPSRSAEPNYGYANSTFRYFYNPGDNKIYYMSANSVYRMDIDGTNSASVRCNAPGDRSTRHYDEQYIYVSNDTVYYNNRVSNTTYRMKTDGTEHKVEEDEKSGAMGKYGTGGSSVLYFSDGRKRYLKDNTLYFEGTSYPNLSRQTPPGTGPLEILSNKKADNFVFAPEGIYFRLRKKSDGSDYYGIRKANYDVTPRGSGEDARLNENNSVEIVPPGTDGAYHADSPTVWASFKSDGTNFNLDTHYVNTLNVSKNFIAYITRGRGGLDVGSGLNVVERPDPSGTFQAPRTVRSQLSRFNLAINSGINIIGDYLYWMTDNKNAQQYKLHRVKKDSTDYRVVKEMPY